MKRAILMDEATNDRILRLARDRGRRCCTFATQDELRTPGYTQAWEQGYQEAERERMAAEAVREDEQLRKGTVT